MMIKRMESSRNTNLAFATLARSLADEVAGEGVNNNRSLEYEIALKRVAMRLGMTVGEMYHYLSYNKTDSV
jgi:thermostable 8-oxoguanine DNA glycosylase